MAGGDAQALGAGEAEPESMFAPKAPPSRGLSRPMMLIGAQPAARLVRVRTALGSAPVGPGWLYELIERGPRGRDPRKVGQILLALPGQKLKPGTSLLGRGVAYCVQATGPAPVFPFQTTRLWCEAFCDTIQPATAEFGCDALTRIVTKLFPSPPMLPFTYTARPGGPDERPVRENNTSQVPAPVPPYTQHGGGASGAADDAATLIVERREEGVL